MVVRLGLNGSIVRSEVSGRDIANVMLVVIFLLAYKLDNSEKTGLVVFVRTGAHAELFNQ